MACGFLMCAFPPCFVDDRSIDKDKWAAAAAAEAIAELLEIEKQLNIFQDGESCIQVEANPYDVESKYVGEMVLERFISFPGNSIKPEESMGAFDAALDSVDTEIDGQNKEIDNHHHHIKEEDGPFESKLSSIV